MADIGNDGDVGVQALGDHLRAAQAHFFLHRVDDVEAEIELLLARLQQPRHFRDHEAADAVVDGAADQLVAIEHEEFIRVGDHAADVNAERLDLIPGTATDVDEDIVELRRLLLRPLTAGVDRRPAEHARHDAVVGMDVDPF